MQQKLNSLKERLDGRAYTPANDPPSYPTRVWIPLTYEAIHLCNGDSTGTSVSLGAILDECKARYAVATAGQVAMQVLRSQVWAISGGPDFPVPGLEADFYEIANSPASSAIARHRTRDNGTLQRPASAAFVYPSVDQKDVTTADDKDKLVVAATGTFKGTKLVIRVQVRFYSF